MELTLTAGCWVKIGYAVDKNYMPLYRHKGTDFIFKDMLHSLSCISQKKKKNAIYFVIFILFFCTNYINVLGERCIGFKCTVPLRKVLSVIVLSPEQASRV